MTRDFQLQMNYQTSEDPANDDNERDPSAYRYSLPNNFTPDYAPFAVMLVNICGAHRYSASTGWTLSGKVRVAPFTVTSTS